jgi:hypothetical protein
MPTDEEQQRAAAERLFEHYASQTEHTRGAWWLPYITANGRALWDVTYRGLEPNDPERDTTATARLIQHVRALPDTENHRVLKLAASLPTTVQDLTAQAHWLDSCCPILTVGHRAAAAMIATSVPDSFELQCPWPCLLVEVPDKLIEIMDPRTERPFWVRYCLVRRSLYEGEPLWSLIATGDGTQQLAGTRMVSTRRLLSESERLNFIDDRELNALEHRLDTQTQRAIICLVRLVANMLIVATEPRFQGSGQPSMRQLGKHRAAVRGGPDHRRFVVHAPVDIDLREHVRHFVRTGRRLPAAASHVPGHWRRVACGANHSERRIQWIAPYFRCADAEKIVTKTRRVAARRERSET